MTTHLHSLLSFASGQWLPLCINVVLQSLVVLTVAGAAVRLAGKASASWRHLLLVGAQGALLLLPVFAFLLPAKPIATVPAKTSTLHQANTHPFSILVSSHSARASGSAESKAAPSPAVPASMPAPSPFSASTPADTRAGATRYPRSLFALGLFALWIAGSLLSIARLCIGWRRLRRLTRRCPVVSEKPLRAFLDTLMAEVGFKHRVQILQAAAPESVAVPMTWGTRRPVLLLPAEATQWPPERLRVVVLHELAHIRRGDWLTQVLGQTVCSLYWFHPLVRRLYNRAQREAENACDDAVLLSGVPAAEYAAHLLDVVRAVQGRQDVSNAAVLMARPSQVSERIRFILNSRRRRGGIARSAPALLLSMGLMLLPISRLRPLAQASEAATVDATTAAPSSQAVILPDGVRVELLGVSESPDGSSEDWWSADGKILPQPPQQTNNRFHNSFALGYTEPRSRRRSLFFRLNAPRALDKNGQSVPLDEGSLDYHGDGSIELSAKTLARIDIIQLQTRPYQWAEFKDIALQSPYVVPATTATPPALPGYSHTFACGLTLTLAGLTKRKADGGRWWQPNGTLLAGPLKEFKNRVSFQGWREQEHPREFLLKETATRDVSFNIATQFLPDSRWQKGIGRIYDESAMSNRGAFPSTWNVSFPPEVRKCTLRYGVAAGPWQTIAALSMPAGVKHSNKPPDSFDGDVTLVMSDQPHLEYQNLSGGKRESKFLKPDTARLGNVARRFVAVDTAGKRIPLTNALSGIATSIIPLTFRDTGVLHGYNPIDLSRIREFRLQTRPYEWTEFPNIRLQPNPK